MIDMSLWSGRTDAGEGDLARRWHQVVKPLMQNQSPGIVLLGFGCDEGVRRNQGRIGAAAGPVALRRALANLAWHPGLPIYDAGNVVCHNGDLEAAHEALAQCVTDLIQNGHFPLVLGGGHETAYGHWLGLANAGDAGMAQRIGIINLDAHLDLRQSERATSGTPFAQIAAECAQRNWPFHYLCLGVAEPANTQALFDTARRLGAEWRLDTEMVPWRFNEICTQVSGFISQVDKVYLTIDLDVLPAGCMPAVSAPAGFGVDIDVIEALIAHIARSGKLMATDLVEFNPDFDQDNHGAKAAARLAWSIARYLSA